MNRTTTTATAVLAGLAWLAYFATRLVELGWTLTI